MLKKTLELIKKCKRLLATAGPRYAVELFLCRVLHRAHEPRMLANRKLKLDYLKRKNKDLLDKCAQNPLSGKKNEGPIWVFWWQGEESMPEIVHCCYTRLKEAAAGKREVVLLTRENISAYLTLPESIYQKVERKLFSYTHLSDVIRMTLLARRGGLWIDSTVYVTGELPDYVFSETYFSGRAPLDPRFVNRCFYTSFLMGCAAGAPWFICAGDIMLRYFKNAQLMLDYFLMDYILITTLDYSPELTAEVEKGIVYTPHIHTLEKLRNKPYSEEEFRKMTSECSFFKLSYKLPYTRTTEKGELTYYGKLLEDYRKKMK